MTTFFAELNTRLCQRDADSIVVSISVGVSPLELSRFQRWLTRNLLQRNCFHPYTKVDPANLEHILEAIFLSSRRILSETAGAYFDMRLLRARNPTTKSGIWQRERVLGYMTK